MSFELHFDETGRVVCELGVIAYPWPQKVDGTRDVANIGPLIVLDGVTMFGLEEWEWLYESGSGRRHHQCDDAELGGGVCLVYVGQPHLPNSSWRL